MDSISNNTQLGEKIGDNPAQLIYVSCDTDSLQVKNKVIQHLQELLSTPVPGSECVLLGNKLAVPDAVTAAEYFTRLYRQHGLHSNERQMTLSQEDHLIAVQLCLAEVNKKRNGDFNVEVSRVMDATKQLLWEKLSLSEAKDKCMLDEGEFRDVSDLYKEFLYNSNVVDLIDVLHKVQEESTRNEALQKTLAKTHFVIFPSAGSFGDLEKEMITFLAKEKQVKIAHIEMPLDVEDVDTPFIYNVDIKIAESSLEEVIQQCSQSANPTGVSLTESYVEKVVLSYLHLIVNSRCELALANVINVPDRELDHTAFTNLKKAAQHKKMSMYQTALSYIMRIRLGGPSYAPDPNVPLAQHVKGLSEFVDLMHKLQTIIEEEINIRLAMKKVLNAIKIAIVKSQDACLRRQSVDTVNERLQAKAVAVIEASEKVIDESPQRTASAGGSMLGRKTLKVIQHILDSVSAQRMTMKSVDILTDGFSSQKTPIRFPCLMSKFRSPIEDSPGSKLNRTLAERMKEKMKKKQKKDVVQRYQTHMDWAKPLHDTGFNQEELLPTILDFAPSKTIVHPGQKDKPIVARKLPETQHDQENVTAVETHPADTTAESKSDKSKKVGSTSAKRSLGSDVLKGQPASKKAKKTQSSSQPKTSKKKIVPQKGQKQLTAFFRL